MYGSRSTSSWLPVIGIAVVAMLGFGGSCAFVYGTQETKTFKVKRLDTKMTGSGEDKKDMYLVFTDEGVFRNEDTIFYAKCNSSDVQNKFEKGKCYRAKVYGIRFGCGSHYKNIVSAEEIPCSSR